MYKTHLRRFLCFFIREKLHLEVCSAVHVLGVFRVNLTLDIYSAEGQVERFVRRDRVTLSVHIATNSRAGANF